MLFIGIVGRHYLQMDDEGEMGKEGEQVVLDAKEKGRVREKNVRINYSFDRFIEIHKPMGSGH